MGKLLLEKHKLMYHPDVLDKFKRGEKFAPVNLELSIATICNQACQNCYVKNLIEDKRSPALMDGDLLMKIIRDSADFGVKSITVCGTGEPLIHPRLGEAIRLIKAGGMDTALVTNGVLGSREKMEEYFGDLTYYRISTTAGSPARYADLQGSSEEAFARLLRNLEELVALKRDKNLKTTMGAAYFLLPGCEEDMYSFTARMKEIGLDYVQIKPLGDFKKADYEYEKSHYKMVNEELRRCESLNDDKFTCLVRYSRFEDFEKMAAGFKDLPKECWALYFTAVIGTDGKLYTCGGSWYEAKDCYGDLSQNTLKEIWQSERWQQIFSRRMHINCDECFFACRNNELNKYLENFREEPAHINFI